MIRIVVPLLILGLQYLVYRKTSGLLREAGARKSVLLWVAAVFIAMNVLAFGVMLSSASLLNFPQWVRDLTLSPVFIWQGSTFFLALIILLGSLIIGVSKLLMIPLKLVPSYRRKVDERKLSEDQQRLLRSRRSFMRKGAYAVAAVSFGGTSYGTLVERRKTDVTSAEFVLDSLHPALDGFTIGLISDIHSSINMPKSVMEKYVSQLNSLGCDLIVVDGDFINSAVEEVYPFSEAFSELHAPFGVYGVMGNHDYYNRDPERVVREVSGCGIRLLFDDSVSISRNGGSFNLLGIDDVGTKDSATRRMKTAVGRSDGKSPRILMCHRPYYLPEAAALGIDLVLSGHTHGGQIVLGRVGETVFAPASLASRYIWGTYQEGRSSMYVSRGIGTVGVPVRINCPPEITRIILRSGTNANNS